jgi:ketosteroid isomerase-like protein
MPMSRLLLVPLLLCASQARADALPPEAQQFLSALTALQQANASEAEVDRLLALCTDDVVYEHSRVGAVVRGKKDLRAGFVAHLGEVRGDRTRVVRSAQGPKLVALEISREFEVKDGNAWRPVKRTQLLVLERDGTGKIRRVLDDW